MARVLILCLLLSSPCLAQSLADPLRPPAGFVAGQGGSTEPSGELLLQSVLLDGGRRVAVISAQPVVLGQRVAGYRLIQLSENRAVLQGAQGRLLLYLIPQSRPATGVEPRQPESGGTQK